MKVFFGAAIQGLGKRGERSPIYGAVIEAIKKEGHTVVSEHTVSDNMAETARLLEQSIGPLPPVGIQRSIYVRNKMIEAVESKDLGAAVFEVSTPSLGTGVEIAHAYLRPRMGLPPLPTLALYQTDYWPNSLSSMVRGIPTQDIPHFALSEFSSAEEARKLVRKFLQSIFNRDT